MNANITFTLITTIFIFLAACKDSDLAFDKGIKMHPIKVDVESAIDNVKTVYLSEIATCLKYIPLETTPHNLISTIRQLEITKSFIFVSDGDILLKFARDGKFIKRIGRSGRGPGEYRSIMRFVVNEAEDFILINGEYKSIRYDLSGKYIKKETNLPGMKFICNGHDRIVFYMINHEQKPKNLIVTDGNLNILHEFLNPSPRPKTNLKFTSAPLYLYNNKFYFKENFNDTVFCINDSILEPHIILDESRLLIDKDFSLQSTGKISDLINQLEEVENKLLTKDIFESERFIFITYLKGQDPRKVNYTRILFDKKDYNAVTVGSERFLNDIDGGLNFWPKQSVSDSVVLSWAEAHKLIEQTSSEAFKKSHPKYLDQKEGFEEMVGNLTVTENPVLMVIKLNK